MAVGNRKVQDVSNVLDFLPFMENHFSWKATLFTSIILRNLTSIILVKLKF